MNASRLNAAPNREAGQQGARSGVSDPSEEITFDFDFLIAGSGFGGSVSALRLVEKGYSVGVLEMGRRHRFSGFANTSWQFWKYLWLPRLFCYGIQRVTFLRNALIFTGTGVGGGSLVYAGVLMEPPGAAWADPAWAGIADWKSVLKPHYDTARRMLGVTQNPKLYEADTVLRDCAREIGRDAHWKPADVGIYFGDPDQLKADPYFNGHGPERKGCIYCGGCLIGCRQGAKNSLDLNYLHLAERNGARVFSDRQVTLIRPLSTGFALSTERPGRILFKEGRQFTARCVILSAGVLGTVPLLLRCKQRGTLPKLSEVLGRWVRTNGEAIIGVRTSSGRAGFSPSIADTSRLQIDGQTTVQVARYPRGSDLFALISTLLPGGRGGSSRFLRFLFTCAQSPIAFLKSLVPFGWAKQSVLLIFMRQDSSAFSLSLKRRWYWPFSKCLSSAGACGEEAERQAALTARSFARRFAARLGGYLQCAVTDALFKAPTTVHPLGGCVMGRGADEGVVDMRGRVFGYTGLYVMDASIIAANLGLNPSLTVAALAEHAMSYIPPKTGRRAGD